MGSGANYADAYFEIPFIRAYSPVGQNTISNPSSPPAESSGVSTSGSTEPTTIAQGGAVSPPNSASLSQQGLIQVWTAGMLLVGAALAAF